MISGAMPQAVVLAAGLGKRMRPLTDDLPKPLIPVAGVTLIDRALDWLGNSGVTQAVVNSYYKAELLEAHVAKRTRPTLSISREDVLLETGGGIKKALSLVNTVPFFSINSDVICIDGRSPALHRMLDVWDDSVMDALLLLHPVERAVGYDGKGDFSLGMEGRLQRREPDQVAPYVFTGIQLLHPRLFDASPDGAFSMNVLYDRNLARVHAVVHDGEWLHVGDPAGLRAAESWLRQV